MNSQKRQRLIESDHSPFQVISEIKATGKDLVFHTEAAFKMPLCSYTEVVRAWQRVEELSTLLSSISRPTGWATIVLDVVVIHRFPPNVAVVDEDNHHTLENTPTCLPSLRDLLTDGLHADVSRELSLTPWRIDSGWQKGTFQRVSERDWFKKKNQI